MSEKKPKNPVEKTEGSYRVLRGGYWSYGPDFLESDRDRNLPSDRNYGGSGFRISRTKK